MSVLPTRRPESAGHTQTIAAFDFDGTLTNRHTLWRYVRFVAGARRFAATAVELFPDLARVVVGKAEVMDVRDRLFMRIFAGMDSQFEASLARLFARDHVAGWLRPEARARLAWHQEQGHTTAIVSNSAESYLVHVARALGIDFVVGTRLEVQAGRLTGRVMGKSCVGAEKVARLGTHVANLHTTRLFAYGDSSGDSELLAIADRPYYRSFS
jgi:phosphatidylglycerophosphatase C